MKPCQALGGILMASIIDIYQRHKDLLSTYFKTEQEAIDCEKRAEMGDDRAMRLMSLAYDSKISKKIVVREENSSPYLSASKKDVIVFYPLDTNSRNKWHNLAVNAKNLSSLPFYDAINFGARKSTIDIPEWQPSNRMSSSNHIGGFLLDYSLDIPISAANAGKSGVPYELFPANTSRFELRPLIGDSYFNTLFYSEKVDWPTDKRFKRYDFDPGEKINFDKRNHDAAIICAQAGDLNAATILNKIYSQKTFYEMVTKFHLLKADEHKSNPLYDSVKAKYWERVAEHLQGKTTPIERKKFLDEFLYSQDKTPDGLYNIGYALYHNEHIGDKEKGLDYLKHSANLGNANAARELGEIYHTRFDIEQNTADRDLSYSWYKAAAELGHPNAKSRVSYLEKAYPDIKQTNVDESIARNPSKAHIKNYPASAWYIDVPVIDVSQMIRNQQFGGLVERMQGAVQAIDNSVKEFENSVSIIQSRIDDLAARQLVMDGHVESLKGEEINALRENDRITAQQRISERAQNLSKNRWVKETTGNLGSTIFLSVAAPYLLPGNINMDGGQITRMVVTSVSRASGYRGVMNNEVDYQQAIIDELESRKIDTSKFPEEIKALTKAVQEVADSAPIKQLLKDEIRARALVEGYLRQKILKSGLDNCYFLDEYAKQNEIESVDALLEAIKPHDERLHGAVNNLCYGHANSNDMAVILEDVNAMHGDNLPQHEKALKHFVERVVKGNIGHYMSRASQIDVISDLKLVDFETMNVGNQHSVTELVQGNSELNYETSVRNQVDMATKLALASMFSKQFGVTHVGQYDVTRMFNFYLHRHGKDELIASELYDGAVSDVRTSKKVDIQSPRNIKGFVERAKESAHRGRDDQPDVSNLFLRVCGYEYYLPQAVITSGRGNRFKENPEAPVAYPMVNRVVQSFIEQLSLSDMTTYRKQIGEELDGVIAQTFVDFFHEVGKQHAIMFEVDRERLRDSYKHDNYGPRFDAYEDKIVADTLTKFPLFIELYQRNLSKTLQVAPEAEAKIIQAQLKTLQQQSANYLSPKFPEPGSFKARQAARNDDHRGDNMTEKWQFVK